MNPRDIVTGADLVQALRDLRGGRSYAQLQSAAARLQPRGGRAASLPRSTLSDLLSGKVTPSPETLETYLEVCGINARQDWLDALDRVRARRLDARYRRVTDWDPRKLGVHAAIRVVDGYDRVPDYVRRDIDDHVEAVIRRGVADACVLVLVGTSSVGKSRSAYEGLKAAVPTWPLLRVTSAEQLLEVWQQVPDHLVIWLDELHIYLSDERMASELQSIALSGRNVILVGTIWPDWYARFAATPAPGGPDVFARERRILDMATVVHVPDSLSVAEVERAKKVATTDSQVRAALAVNDYGMTQVLAAAPHLVHRWEQAGTPYAKALLTCAIDARRLGVPRLTTDLLKAGTPEYLRPAEVAGAPGDWFAQAIDYASGTLYGATAALRPVPGPEMGSITGYELADYLFEYGRNRRTLTPLPARMWTVLLDGTDDVREMTALGRNAFGRSLFEVAETCYRRAIAEGDSDARSSLAEVLTRTNRFGEALALYSELADEYASENPPDQSGEDAWQPYRRGIEELRQTMLLADQWRRGEPGEDAESRFAMAAHLSSTGSFGDAIQMLRGLARDGEAVACQELSGLHDREGLRELTNAGDGNAAWFLAELLFHEGRFDDLHSLVQEGLVAAHVFYADVEVSRGNVVEATELLRVPARSWLPAVQRAAYLFLRSGDYHRAEQIFEQLVAMDEPDGALQYADYLAWRGRREEAVAVLREGPAARHDFAAHLLASLTGVPTPADPRFPEGSVRYRVGGTEGALTVTMPDSPAPSDDATAPDGGRTRWGLWYHVGQGCLISINSWSEEARVEDLIITGRLDFYLGKLRELAPTDIHAREALVSVLARVPGGVSEAIGILAREVLEGVVGDILAAGMQSYSWNYSWATEDEGREGQAIYLRSIQEHLRRLPPLVARERDAERLRALVLCGVEQARSELVSLYLQRGDVEMASRVHVHGLAADTTAQW